MQAFQPPSYDNSPDATWTTADLCDAALGQPDKGLRVLPDAYRQYGGNPWYFGSIVVVPALPQGQISSLAGLLSQSGDGRVLVVDGGPLQNTAIFGDRMACMAVQNGWRGVLIHGYVRDTATLARLPLGVHALGTRPNRAEVMLPAQAGEAVTLHGMSLRTGEWLYADGDGVIVLAERHAPPRGPA